MRAISTAIYAVSALLAGVSGTANAQTPSLELGTRYWVSEGRARERLSDVTRGAPEVSQLTFTSPAATGEVFGRLSLPGKWYLKGYAGIGNFFDGKLIDEDFVSPGQPQYSRTESNVNGRLSYLSGDVGYHIIDNPTFKLGPIVGLHYWQEKLNAYGCTQIAANPDTCVPAIGKSVLGITQVYRWRGLRVGAATEVMMGRWTLQAEAAYVRASVDMDDTHWLRLFVPNGFNGATPTSATSNGLQLESVLSYRVTNAFSVGVGARYWKYEPAEGVARFDLSAIPVGTFAGQQNTLSAERYGGFLQGSFRF